MTDIGTTNYSVSLTLEDAFGFVYVATTGKSATGFTIDAEDFSGTALGTGTVDWIAIPNR